MFFTSLTTTKNKNKNKNKKVKVAAFEEYLLLADNKYCMLISILIFNLTSGSTRDSTSTAIQHIHNQVVYVKSRKK